jgi:hypothetical protein
MSNTHSLDLELSSSQYASRADTASLSITTNFTIEAWIKLEQLSSTAGTNFEIVAKYDSTDEAAYRFVITTGDDKMNLIFWEDNTTLTQISCDTAFVGGDVGVWRHVAVSVDISEASGTFYIDSAAKADTVVDNSATVMRDTTSSFRIGANGLGGGAQFFDGKIDDVRVWNDIRSSGEIANNYKGEISPSSANLAANWRLNNDYTDPVNSNTLTGSGSPVFSTDVPFIVAEGSPI